MSWRLDVSKWAYSSFVCNCFLNSFWKYLNISQWECVIVQHSKWMQKRILLWYWSRNVYCYGIEAETYTAMVLKQKRILLWYWSRNVYCYGIEAETYNAMVLKQKRILLWYWSRNVYCYGIEAETYTAMVLKQKRILLWYWSRNVYLIILYIKLHKHLIHKYTQSYGV